MTTIVTRAGKGTTLSWTEMDANLTNLNNDKVELTDLGDSATLDVGTAAGTVAAGNHNHTGVYEPADATILKDADIGVTVQGYDADIPTVAASQAEMETGTEVDLRSMSPLRVAQAIAALAPAAPSVNNIPQNITFSGDISPTSISASQNDYNPTGLSTASTLRLTSSAAYDITGLQGGADGRLLFAHNVGSYALTLKNESASSTAANRFATGADIAIQPGCGCVLQYDSTSSRWRCLSKPEGSASGYVSTDNGSLAVGSSGIMTPYLSNTCADGATASSSTMRFGGLSFATTTVNTVTGTTGTWRNTSGVTCNGTNTLCQAQRIA